MSPKPSARPFPPGTVLEPPAGRPLPIAPTEEAWRAMSPAERERFLVHVLDVLSDPWVTMSEGRPHKKSKTRSIDMIGLHFGALGRVIYLAEEMAVVYPGKEPFTPDVLAVLDVPETENDERMAWVVADEGKGLDLVVEVLHHGDRKKDLVDNVTRYADLGIPEYFVYDRARQALHGYRLPAAGAKRYVPILAQGGRYHSAVLGLDLAIEGGEIRFFHGMAELFGSADLIRRLTAMVQDRSAEAEQAAAEVEDARAKAAQAIASLQASLLAVLDARKLEASDALRDRIRACDDPQTLQRWHLRALSAASADEALSDATPS